MEMVCEREPHRDPFPNATTSDWITRWGCVHSSSDRRQTVPYRGHATQGRKRRPTPLRPCRARHLMNSYAANASTATRSATGSCDAAAADLNHRLLFIRQIRFH